jgi:formamidopyrimidine-DNA glycosylase
VPELPEVETVRRGLVEHVVQRRIDGVELGRERAYRRVGADRLIAGLVGSTVVSVDRRGKYLLFALDSTETLMVHLRMSGQLLVHDATTPRPAHTHVVLNFANQVEVRFVDPRTFGEVVVFGPDDVESVVPELARLGPDPLVDTFDETVLRRSLARTRRALKAVLLDQSVIAGIGNIYGDEILHRARLNPLRPANRVNREQTRRLVRAVVDVLNEAVSAGGSTLRDAQYVDPQGRAGSFQERHRVYGRTGQSCVTCDRGRIKSASIGGRTSHWCAVCQR